MIVEALSFWVVLGLNDTIKMMKTWWERWLGLNWNNTICDGNLWAHTSYEVGHSHLHRRVSGGGGGCGCRIRGLYNMAWWDCCSARGDKQSYSVRQLHQHNMSMWLNCVAWIRSWRGTNEYRKPFMTIPRATVQSLHCSLEVCGGGGFIMAKEKMSSE